MAPKRSARLRRIGAALTALLFMIVFASPALAQDGSGVDNDLIVLTGRADVAEDQTVGDIVIFDGPVSVQGTVEGDIFAFNGRVMVSGTVQGDIVTFNGRVIAEANSQIDGDVKSRPAAQIDDAANVGGSVGGIDYGRFDDAVAATSVVLWIAFTVSALILGLLFVWLFPRAADAIAVAGDTRTGASIGWGFLLFFGIPIIGVLLLVTLVGIPLGIAFLLAVVPLYSLGYVASTYYVGRRVLGPPRPRALSFLVGLAILRVLALIPILGGLIWFAATVFGLGLLIVAARSQRAEPTPERAPTPAPA
jgi:hypothetical protein